MKDCRQWQKDLFSDAYRNDWNPSVTDDVMAFSNRMRNLIDTRFKEIILRLLEFELLLSREEEICKAYRETYEWIFDGEALTEKGAADFTAWLGAEEGANIYWITGKAGSGKSTLMKFIFQDPRTEDMFQKGHWGAEFQVSMAAFFFWSPGSHTQKSREGLLRTLLYQVLKTDPNMIPRVFEQKYMEYGRYPTKHTNHWDWTWAELKRAFEIMVSDASRRYVFFVDGLDELNGTDQTSTIKETEEVLHLLLQAGKLPHVKICASSRPWLIFEDAFENGPSLTMECLNRDDILRYVTGEFENNAHFGKLKERQPDFAAQLMNNIVEKSSAVFFWVYLVVHSLLRGLINSDRISDLQRRLDELPSELEALFERIMGNLEPFYYTHACQLFQIFEAYNKFIPKKVRQRQVLPMTLLALYFADDDNPTAAFDAEVVALSMEQANDKEEDMRRRLNSRCQGLLEATENTSEENTAAPKVRYLSHRAQYGSIVRYLHRTARDYILEPRIWSNIKRATGPSFDPFLSVAHSALLQLKTLDMEKVNVHQLLTFIARCCFSIGHIESKDLSFTSKYLDEVDRTANILIYAPLANGRPWLSVRLGMNSAQNWIRLYTAYPITSLLDFAIGAPPDFEGTGPSGSEENIMLHDVLSEYAVFKIQDMAPLDKEAAVYWLNKCNRAEIRAALQTASPRLDRAALQAASQPPPKKSRLSYSWFSRKFKTHLLKQR